MNTYQLYKIIIYFSNFFLEYIQNIFIKLVISNNNMFFIIMADQCIYLI